MRDIATRTITTTATLCGLPESAMFQELEDERKEKVMLPERRLEMAFLEERLTRQGWRVGKVPVSGEQLVSRTRYARFKAELPVRVLVRDTNQGNLDAFCREFLAALPSKVRDVDHNWVRVSAHKAVRKGYTFASIRIEESPVQALHISFSGMVWRDEDAPYITNLTIHTTVE